MEKKRTEIKFNKLNLLLIAIVVVGAIVIFLTFNPPRQTPTSIPPKEEIQITDLIIDHRSSNPEALSQISQEDLDKARHLRVLFNHQSVGGNILDGLDNLASQDSTRYSLTRQSKPHSAWYDTHAGVGDFFEGNNGSPVSKVEGFNSLVRNGYRPHIQVAMMKFCYVDFGDAQAAWKSYSIVMQALIRDFPEVKFVWWTAPTTNDVDANDQKAVFNQLVRQHVARNGGILFDLADIESHDPSGNAVTNGGIEAMYAGYTSDGGHLNQTGSQRVASAWWQLMSRLAKSSRGQTPTSVPSNGKVQITDLVINHSNSDLSALSQENLDKARQLKVLFNHQSVGGDILGGLDNLASQGPARYLLVRQSEPQPAWYDTHSGVGDFSRGNNGDPASKAKGFDSLIRNGYGSHVQVAMMKFCYVDFGDGQAAWNAYSKVMQALIKDFPDVKFVWWTAPTTSDVNANDQKEVFNQLVRQHVAKNGGILFDLADIESHDPAGNAVKNSGVEAMYAGYTSDGGHLNQTGSQRVASAWWQLMSRLANSAKSS